MTGVVTLTLAVLAGISLASVDRRRRNPGEPVPPMLVAFLACVAGLTAVAVTEAITS